MNSEREIVMKLREAKELDESSFEAGGKNYKCAFGKYYCDGEQISRDEYFKAKDGGSSSTSSNSNSDVSKKPAKKSYEDYTSEEFDVELDDLEIAIDDLRNDMTSYDYDSDERANTEDELDEIKDKLYDMQEYLSDDQYEKSEELISYVLSAKEVEYNGPDYNRDPYKERGLRREDFY